VPRFGSRLFELGVLIGLVLVLPPAPRGRAESPPPEDRAFPVDGGGRSASRTVEVLVEPGDTLIGILERQGIGPGSRRAVLGALRHLFDDRHLRVGDRIRLTVESGGSGPVVRALRLETGKAQDLTIHLGDAPASAPPQERAELVVRQVEGTVGADFRSALLRAQLPAALVDRVLTAFQYDPDLPHHLPIGARFSVVYEASSEEGRLSDPRMRYVSIDDGSKVHQVYRYDTEDGKLTLVHDDGRGIELIDLEDPVAGAKVTSPYGWRIHPVLGDRRFHKGVDFGAAAGTPVVAAADGVVEEIGWRGNYGEYLRIRHDGHLQTSYAHLSRFAPGLHRGARVRRGQVIAFVGRTGLATGPHLYFEVLVDRARVDPLALPPAVPIRLSGRELVRFREQLQPALVD
jgi:murein DD-endopeptidase MepM/ murein hydrolase activator NlpD